MQTAAVNRSSYIASRSHAFTRGETTAELCSFARNRATQSDCRSGKRHVRAHSSAYALPVGYIHVHCTKERRIRVSAEKTAPRDRFRVMYAYMYIHVDLHCTCMGRGRNRSTVVIIMSLRVYQGCCYVSGYYYAKRQSNKKPSDSSC